ncbi:MAG: hypothetical protein C0407_13590, partial [Desulfobacca sp.]|nr:hypothetical protein [Desulfobacca sp.]
MGTRPGFYKSGKRNKELARQKKQEEKKLRRLNKGETTGPEIPEAIPEALILDPETENQDQEKP